MPKKSLEMRPAVLSLLYDLYAFKGAIYIIVILSTLLINQIEASDWLRAQNQNSKVSPTDRRTGEQMVGLTLVGATKKTFRFGKAVGCGYKRKSTKIGGKLYILAEKMYILCGEKFCKKCGGKNHVCLRAYKLVLHPLTPFLICAIHSSQQGWKY